MKIALSSLRTIRPSWAKSFVPSKASVGPQLFMEYSAREKYFELEDLGNNIFRSKKLIPNSPRSSTVYGGLLFAQSLAAAEATVPDNLLVHAMHSMFLYAAVVDEPISYYVAALRDGQSFCSRHVRAEQRDNVIFSCQLSFQKKEEAAIRHQIDMPKVLEPDKCLEVYDGIESILKRVENGKLTIDSNRVSRLKERLSERSLAEEGLFEMRPVSTEQFLGCVPSEPTTFVWCKAREKLGDDPRIHRMFAMYNTDSTLAGTPVRYHQSRGFIPSQLFSLDHSAWLHSQDFRADDWMLYENRSIVADGGRAFTEGRMWTSDGRLICSTAQECLVRTRSAKSLL